MTVLSLADSGIFKCVCLGDEPSRTISKVYCCDLLSIAMGRAPVGSAWVTVMANMNTLAVASLTDAACVILAEGAALDDLCLQKAKTQGITVFETALPVFDAALKIHEIMNVPEAAL